MTDEEIDLLLTTSAMVHGIAEAQNIALKARHPDKPELFESTQVVLDKVADLAQRIEARQLDTGVKS